MESSVLAIEGILEFEHRGTRFLWCLHLKSRKTLLKDSMIHYESMCNESFNSLSMIQEFIANIPCNLTNEHNQRCSLEQVEEKISQLFKDMYTPANNFSSVSMERCIKLKNLFENAQSKIVNLNDMP
ncbi:hypothetical protein KI387_016546, partial [Taxus chinensis]